MPQNHFTIIIRYIYCTFRIILWGLYFFLKMFSPTFILFYSMQIVFRISTFLHFLYDKFPSILHLYWYNLAISIVFFLQVLLVIVFEQRIIRLFVSHAQFYKSIITFTKVQTIVLAIDFYHSFHFSFCFSMKKHNVRLIMATFYNLCLKDFFFFSLS